MYQIICENPNGATYILHDTRVEDYKVFNPQCKMKLNTTGTLSFSIYPTHPHYGVIQKLKSEISLYQDGEWLFTGRVLNDEKDFENIKAIDCEGELSYLLDSNQRQAEYHNISVENYFTDLITKHNAMVDDFKRFTVGQVTVTDTNDELYRYSNYEDTFKIIQDKLINRLGGYIRTRRYNGTRYIDYIADYGNINNQCIRFGENLLDLAQYVTGDSVKTAIIPLGAKITDEQNTSAIEERLTIETVNGGLDYIFDQDAVDLYGWIWDTVLFDDVTTPSALKTKGEAALASQKQLTLTLELTAVDLHLIDIEIERIKVGDTIRVISDPHEIDRFMTVSEVNIDIQTPANSSIILGDTILSLTEISNKNNVVADVENIKSDYVINKDLSVVKNNITELSSSITQTAQNILLEVYSNYASKDELSSINQLLQTSVEILNNMIEFKFTSATSQTETLEGVVTSNQTLLEEYIRFQGALIELGRVGNSFTAQLSNTELSFLQNNVKIAYISNNKLYITDAEIKNKLTIGNADNGFWDFIPRANGNLSLKWRVN
jgi:hypothetical protein